MRHLRGGRGQADSALPLLANPWNAKIPRYFCLAHGRVRFVGEPVVAFAVKEEYRTEDASELFDVQYDELPAVLDPEEALRSRVNLYDEMPGNLYGHLKWEHGDVDKSFKESHLVIEERFRIGRQAPVPMEPHGIIAYYNRSTKRLKVWSSTQIPHDLRTVLSKSLKIKEESIEVKTGDIGGGFGAYKYHPEDIAVALMSVITGRPVKWVATRRELFLSGYHAREQTHKARIGVSKEGRILAFEDKIVAATGAYLTRETLGPPGITSLLLPGPYKIPNMKVDLFCAAVNKSPSSAYRGFGQPQANFVMERCIDMVARALKIDPAELRFRNFVQPEEFPYLSPTGVRYDTGDYPRCLSKALALAEYPRLIRRTRSGSAARVRRGVGIAFYVEVTNYSFPHSNDSVTARLEASGRVSVLTGLSPHGQGTETVIAQLAAEAFGLEMSDIQVRHGDTAVTPYSQGTFGSRSSTLASESIMSAAGIIIEKARKIAAKSLGVEEGGLSFSDGLFFTKGARKRSIHLREIARLGGPAGFIEAKVVYRNTENAVSYGAHVAVVDVDSETGVVSVVKYYIVHDCGTIINPAGVEGQILGGLLQGLGGSLIEELVYDENGQLLTSTLMDYMTPTSMDLPSVTVAHTSVPSSVNRLGIKGVGESAVIPVYAAIANAIVDAGVPTEKMTSVPFKPEAVWTSLRKS